MRPVSYSDDLPVPTPLVNKDLLSSSDEEMPSREDSAESISLEDIESTYSGTSGNEPDWVTQEDLNDLARDLYLSKQQSELLASQLKQWNLVQEDVRITSFRNRNKDLASFFDMENKLCNCTNIPGLRGYGVPNVTQDSFSPFPPQLLPAKPWNSEWWAWRKIPPRHYEDGEQLSRQMEPRHDGRLLLDALAWHLGYKIHQIF